MSDWRPMSDPPPAEQMVLFFGKDKGSRLFNYEVGTLDPAWGCEYIKPTHWRPLPEPPTAEPQSEVRDE